jgi:hypothetical protein
MINFCINWILNGSDDGVYHSESLGFCTSSVVQYSRNTFQKLNLFSSSVGGKTSTLLGLLEVANLSHWTTHVTLTRDV